MDWRLFATVFGTMFLAELGDKTQLATISFVCTSKYPLAVFLGGSLALVLSTLLAVLVGAGLQKVVPVKILHIIAAIAFIVIGVLLLIKNLRTT
ncbi:MAG: TMEM165/GDT1 family protein [bacterium]